MLDFSFHEYIQQNCQNPKTFKFLKLENSRSENVRQSVLPDPAKLLLELTNALCFTANYDLHGLLQVSFEKF